VQRWRGQDDIPTDWGRCVVTIGVFDGVHRGHQRIVARAAPQLQKVLAAAMAEGGWFGEPHEAETLRAAGPAPRRVDKTAKPVTPGG